MNHHHAEMEVMLTAGGLDDMSYVTRLIPATSFVMREDMRRKISGGNTYLPKRCAIEQNRRREEYQTYQSAVIKSSVWTARRAMTCLKSIKKQQKLGNESPVHTCGNRPLHLPL
jgi:hypothetical protein